MYSNLPVRLKKGTQHVYAHRLVFWAHQLYCWYCNVPAPKARLYWSVINTTDRRIRYHFSRPFAFVATKAHDKAKGRAGEAKRELLMTSRRPPPMLTSVFEKMRRNAFKVRSSSWAKFDHESGVPLSFYSKNVSPDPRWDFRNRSEASCLDIGSSHWWKCETSGMYQRRESWRVNRQANVDRNRQESNERIRKNVLSQTISTRGTHSLRDNVLKYALMSTFMVGITGSTMQTQDRKLCTRVWSWMPLS